MSVTDVVQAPPPKYSRFTLVMMALFAALLILWPVFGMMLGL